MLGGVTARDLKERRHLGHHRLWGDMLDRAAHGWMCFEKGSGKVWCLVKCDGVGRWEAVMGNQGWRIIARKVLASPS